MPQETDIRTTTQPNSITPDRSNGHHSYQEEIEAENLILKSLQSNEFNLKIENLILEKIKKNTDPNAKASKRMAEVMNAVDNIPQDNIEKELFNRLPETVRDEYFNNLVFSNIKQKVKHILEELKTNLASDEGVDLFVVEEHFLLRTTEDSTIQTLYQFVREYLAPYWKTQRKTNIWDKISNFLNGYW